VAFSRNSPCPCGSGKKYKKCCLESEQAERSAQSLPYSETEVDAVLGALSRYAERDEFAEFIDVSMQHFFAGIPGDVPDPLEIPECRIGFWGWSVLDMPARTGGETIADLFGKKHAARLSRGEQRYLNALRGAELRLYEVIVVASEGAMLRDALSGEPVFTGVDLREQGIHRWDVLGARIVRDEGMLELIEPFYAFSPLELPELVACVKTGRRTTKRFLRDEGAPAGDDKLEAKLSRTLLAPIVNAVWMLTLAGEAEESEGEPQLQLFDLASLDEAAPVSAQERQQRMLDTPVPWLGGRTLRAAARQKSQRGDVLALLKAIEQSESERRAAGDETIDEAALWDELGLLEHK
jgi:hypothetical protein